MKYFEDFIAGSVVNYSSSHEFTAEEIIEFATKWDPQPFHIDQQAAEASIFAGLVACSTHIISAVFNLSIKDEAVAVISALGYDKLKMQKPVYAGDLITRTDQVKQTRLSNSMPGAGVIEVAMLAKNQNDQVVMSCELAALIKCRETE